MEYGVNELVMKLHGLLRVVESVVDIGGAVVESRKQETERGRSRYLTYGVGMELIIAVEVPQLRVCILYGTNRADDIAEHLIRGVSLRFPVVAPIWHVVAVRGKQNDIIAVTHIECVDDFLI